MILRCNYEELTALRSGAQALLEGGPEASCAVAAPPASRAEVAAVLPRLAGDVGITTLEEQRRVAAVVQAIVECLRVEMEAAVLASHPAHEHAVAAYFEFAHSRAVMDRLDEMGREMTALIEVVTGQAPTDEIASSFQFPD